MTDPTEAWRRDRVAEINGLPGTHEQLLKQHGEPVLATAEMTARFEVLGFMAPFVMVRERATGKKGTLEFQHRPRFYFNWVEDK